MAPFWYRSNTIVCIYLLNRLCFFENLFAVDLYFEMDCPAFELLGGTTTFTIVDRGDFSSLHYRSEATLSSEGAAQHFHCTITLKLCCPSRLKVHIVYYFRWFVRMIGFNERINNHVLSDSETLISCLVPFRFKRQVFANPYRKWTLSIITQNNY